MESFVEEASHDDEISDPLFSVVSKEEKMALIAADYDVIDKMCAQLDRIEKILPCIDSPVFKELQSLRVEQLPELQENHKRLEAKIIHLAGRVQSLLDSYNKTVSTYQNQLTTVDDNNIREIPTLGSHPSPI
jgi:hypothetical protein